MVGGLVLIKIQSKHPREQHVSLLGIYIYCLGYIYTRVYIYILAWNIYIHSIYILLPLWEMVAAWVMPSSFPTQLMLFGSGRGTA